MFTTKDEFNKFVKRKFGSLVSRVRHLEEDNEGETDHSHSNMTALNAVSGVNTGDQDLSTYALKDIPGTVAYATSVALDFNAVNVQTISLTGNITFAETTNKAAGKQKVVRIIADASTRTLSFPSSWVFLGDTPPTSIAAGKTAILSLYCFGTNATDVVASYAVQP